MIAAKGVGGGGGGGWGDKVRTENSLDVAPAALRRWNN